MDESPAYNLAETASNQEILTARGKLEIALAGLGRVFADRTKLEEFADKLGQRPFVEVNWNLYVRHDFRHTFYDKLLKLHQQDASDLGLNPSLLNPEQSAELAKIIRQQNLDFINGCLQDSEVARVYQYLNQYKQSPETDQDLADQQTEDLATKALVDVIAPDAIRSELLAAQLRA